MGIRSQEIKISYQSITSADFTPDIDGAYDILFAETLKDYKPNVKLPAQLEKGYCNVFQSDIS